jgi:hypothetical protein
LVGKPEGKRPPGRPKYGWEDNIKMDLVVIRLDGVECIGVAQDREKCRALVNAIMNIRAL